MAYKNIRNLKPDELTRICDLLNVVDGVYRKVMLIQSKSGAESRSLCKAMNISRGSYHNYLRGVDDRIAKFLKVVASV